MDYITTLIAAPAILAIVNLAKRYGLTEKWAPLAAIVAGGILGTVASFLQTNTINPEHVIFGFITGFAASGLYDIAATVGNNVIKQNSNDVIVVDNENVEVNNAEPQEDTAASY